VSAETPGDEERRVADPGPGPILTGSPEPRPAAAPPRPPSTTFFERVRLAPVTYAICAVNVAVFLFIETHGGTTNAPNLVRWGALERSHVWDGEYFRFVTPMFIHIGWIHLIWNTYYLAGWCSQVERVLGRGRFIFTYLATGMGACAASLLGHDAPGSAGASGAAFGIVAMTMALRWKMLGSWSAFTADPWVRRLGGTLVLWMVLGTYLNFDNYAHGGGFATGALLGFCFVGAPSLSKEGRSTLIGAFVVALGALVAVAAHHWPWESSVWEAYRSQMGG
jgi:rhomboid protease GluP